MARRSASSYFSAPIVVGFVGLGLLVVWMVTSSSTVPVLDFSREEKPVEEQSINRNEQTDNSNPDSPKEVTKGDTNDITYQDTSNSDTQKNESSPEKSNDKTDNENLEKISEDSDEKKIDSNDVPKPENGDVGGGNDNGGDSKTRDGPVEESNSDSGEKVIEDAPSASEPVASDNSSSETNTSDNMKGQEEEKVEGELEKGNVGVGNGNGGDSKTADGPAEESNSDSGENRIDGPTAGGPVASDEISSERNTSVKGDGQTEEKVDDKQSESSSVNGTSDQPKDQVVNDMFPDGAHSEILNETSTQNGAWSTQAAESKNENEAQQSPGMKNSGANGYSWKTCNVTAGPDYIPCLDNLEAIRNLKNTKHYEHRERHCPEEGPTCLVPLPKGYKQSILWPQSREKIWYYNVPHTKLVEIKGHQNWVKVSGEYLIFPGGGTQFKFGAAHYIDFIEEIAPDIAWGKRTRVVLDVGCGVASFGGFLFDKDVLTMSFAPKDEHEAQVQFALERGIPAILSVMGTKRLPFPGRVFDIIHCARCRVPWHIEGGKLLLELNRLLRPGGYFVWSATPVYQTKEEDVQIWKEMSILLKNICWEVVTINKDKVNRVGIAIYRKLTSNECYEKRQKNEPDFCQESDDPNAAWNVPLQECMHKVPIDTSERGSQWPEQWPQRIEKAPYWLNGTQLGVYGKSAPEDFSADYEHWKHIISKSYLSGMGISWSSVRNVMDMRAVYGGFAAALKDLKVWVMNVVPIDSPDTLPLIYERGLFGIYHDWCESFSTYPRSYDLLHADHLFSNLKKRCKLLPVIAEVDRILRPGGKLIVRDNTETINELENMAKSLHWEVRMIFSKEKQGMLFAVKTNWRPKEVETIISAIE